MAMKSADAYHWKMAGHASQDVLGCKDTLVVTIIQLGTNLITVSYYY
jgi:hypothetical protein